MLKSLLEKYRSYRLRRFLRYWTKRRAKGKSRYILNMAFWWSVTIGSILTLGSYLTYGEVDVIMSAVRFILLFLAGLLIGRLSWRSGEAVYLANEKYNGSSEFGWNESEKSYSAFLDEDENSNYLPWSHDLREDPEQFAEWQSNWQSMEHRRIVDLTNVNKGALFGYDLGPIVSATISLVPEQYVSGVYFQNEICPLCLSSTISSKRSPANLQPRFENLEGLAACVWVHNDCFEDLPLENNLPGFPA